MKNYREILEGRIGDFIEKLKGGKRKSNDNDDSFLPDTEYNKMVKALKDTNPKATPTALSPYKGGTKMLDDHGDEWHWKNGKLTLLNP